MRVRGISNETPPVPFALCWWKPSFLLVLINFVAYYIECVLRPFVNFNGVTAFALPVAMNYCKAPVTPTGIISTLFENLQGYFMK